MLHQSCSLSQGAGALAETCIRHAGQSYAILTEAWVKGSFKTFDYFRTQYLFSAATVLAVASVFDDSNGTKRQDFEFAAELLRKLKGYGSYSACEMVQHVEAMITAILALETIEGAYNATEDLVQMRSLVSIAEGDPQNVAGRTPFDMGIQEPLFEAIFAPHDNSLFDDELERLYLPMQGVGYQA